MDPRAGLVRGAHTSSTGSIAPPLTLPTWATTIAGRARRTPAARPTRQRASRRGSRPRPARRRPSPCRAAAVPGRRSRGAPRRPARGSAARRPRRRARRRARRREQAVPRGGQAGHVRHLAAGDERERRRRAGARAARASQRRRPPRRRRRRATGREAGVLVPRGGEPVRREPGGVGAADDEPEEPRRVHRRQPGRRLAREVGDHLLDRRASSSCRVISSSPGARAAATWRSRTSSSQSAARSATSCSNDRASTARL